MSNKNDDLVDGNVEDDLVTLGELTQYENTVWKFAKTLNCPVRSCASKFSTRNLAIKHYRENHAMHSVLCKICDHPIMLMMGPHHLDTHYHRLHPTVTPPPKVKKIRHKCLMCDGTFKNYFTLLNHMQNRHKKNLSHGSQSKDTALTASSARVSIESISSWSDIGTDKSSDDGTLANSPQSAKSTKSADDLRHLVKRKARSFNLQHRARLCTICGRSLKNYVMACSHYRQAHGRAISMCPLCNKYFVKSSALLQHVAEFHPYKNGNCSKLLKDSLKKAIANRSHSTKPLQKKKSDECENQLVRCNEVTASKGKSPKDAKSKAVSKQTKRTQQNEPESKKVLSENNKVTNDSTKEDDLIILGELTGYRTKRWRFPQTEHCPKTKCAKEFETRAEAINHYRTKHAKYDILCGICKKLISVSGAFNLTRHYLCKHPGNAIPKKLLQQNDRSENTKLSTNPNEVQKDKQSETGVKDTSKNKRPTIQEDDRVSKQPKKNRFAWLTKKADPVTKKSAGAYVDNPSPPSVDLNDFSNDDDDSQQENRAIASNSPRKRAKSTNIEKSPGVDESSGISMKNKSTKKTRLTGIRNKACTLCGKALTSYVDACDHYYRGHGRNVLMCPYCEKYFLQSSQLTKHVLSHHSGANGGDESANREIAANKACNTSNTHQLDHNHSDMFGSTSNLMLTDENATSEFNTNFTSTNFNDGFAEETQPNDEPLNLTVKKSFESSVIIDPKSGALDLSIKNT